MKEEDLIQKWRCRVRCLKHAHFDSANLFGRWNGWVGGSLIFFSAAATMVATIHTRLRLPDTYYAVLAVLGMVITVLASLQLYFRFSERAERHRATAANYARLELEIEVMSTLDAAADGKCSTEVRALQDEWSRLTNGAPIIPKRIYRRHCSHLENGCSGNTG